MLIKEKLKMDNLDNVTEDVVTEKAKFKKYPIEEILKAAKEIDTTKIANEVLVWLEVNLENYIDNHSKMFKIPIDDLDVQAGTNEKCPMTEIKRLQSLYRGIPDDDDDFKGTAEDTKIAEDCQLCRMELNKITEIVHDKMNNNKELLDVLFKRMRFYYEFRGFSKEGKEIVRDLLGFVNILKFEYEAFSVGVLLREGQSPENEDKPEEERKVIKEYMIPEGFVVWTEIAFKDNLKPTALF